MSRRLASQRTNRKAKRTAMSDPQPPDAPRPPSTLAPRAIRLRLLGAAIALAAGVGALLVAILLVRNVLAA